MQRIIGVFATQAIALLFTLQSEIVQSAEVYEIRQVCLSDITDGNGPHVKKGYEFSIIFDGINYKFKNRNFWSIFRRNKRLEQLSFELRIEGREYWDRVPPGLECSGPIANSVREERVKARANRLKADEKKKVHLYVGNAVFGGHSHTVHIWPVRRAGEIENWVLEVRGKDGGGAHGGVPHGNPD